MRRFARLITAIAVVAAVPVGASAKSVVVPEAEVIGVDDDAAFVFADLVRDALVRSGEWKVVARSRTPAKPCAQAPCAGDIATDVDAEHAVTLSLSRLGNKIIVRYALVSHTKQVLLTDRTTSYSVEDLDPMATRIATAVTDQLAFERTVSISTVTENETITPRRQSTAFSHGVGLGALVPLGGSFGGSDYLTEVRFFSLYELRSIAAGLEADVLWSPETKGTSDGGFALNLAGKYFPRADHDTGPFVEAGLGVRFLTAAERLTDPLDPQTTFVNRDSSNGLGAFVGAGVVLFRSADLHLVVSGRYDVSFVQFDALSRGRQAHGVGVNVGLTYTGSRSLCPFF